MLWKAWILCWFIRYFSTAFFFPVPCLYHIQILWISANVWFLAFQNFLVFAVLLFCCFSRCPSRSWWAHTLTCFSLFQCFSAVLPCLDHILTMPWYTGTLTQRGRYISHYNYGCLSIHCNQECLMKSQIVHLGEFDENQWLLIAFSIAEVMWHCRLFFQVEVVCRSFPVTESIRILIGKETIFPPGKEAFDESVAISRFLTSEQVPKFIMYF